MIPNNNIIMILNIMNEEFDFNDHLSSYNSLYIKNCSNLIINISNKITKIIIEKSDKIYLQIYDLIVGIEINSSKNIILQVRERAEALSPKLETPCVSNVRSSAEPTNLTGKFSTFLVRERADSLSNVHCLHNCIPYIGLYKSTLFLQGSINKYLLTLVESYKSSLYNL